MRLFDAPCTRVSSLASANRVRATITLVLIGLFSPTLPAAVSIWDGGGSNDNWTTGANWFALFGSGVAPANNGTADIVMPAMGGLVQTPIVNVPYSINLLRFNDGDGRFVILAAEELTIGAGGITNNDADIQSVIGPVRFSANQTWNAAAGPLQIETVNFGTSDLDLAGAHPIGLIGPIFGSGRLRLATGYTSTVTMSGGVSNTYTDSTEVMGGTLVLQKSGGAVAVPHDLIIANGATVRLAANEQISEAPFQGVKVNAGGLLDINSRTETVASLTVFGGGSVTVAATGKLTAAYAGVLGTWTNAGSLYVGDSADGDLDIKSGGDVTSANGYIGNLAGSTGEVLVEDTGSTWTITDELYVGNYGDGTLEITDGGNVTSSVAYIGRQVDSMSAVTVNGIGSTWTNSHSLVIGSAGTGTLDVINGGQVTSTFGYIGDLNGASRVTVDGAASTWTNTANLEVGSNNGSGTLEVIGGGHVSNVIGFVGKYSQRTGAVTVDGAGSLWTNSSYLHVSADGEGTLDITGGGQVTNTDAYIGWLSEHKMGEVTVDGAGSTWTSMGDVWVGRGAAQGTLEITAGGQASSANGYIGYGDDSTGHVTVSGAGSTWTISGDLYVSIDFDPGTATLSVSDNGTVSASQVIVAPMGGEVHGDGNIVGVVQNGGLVSPGASAGALTIDGDYLQTTTGELVIELASESNYDQLLITGTATIDGTLTVNVLDGFTPSIGQTFTILTANDVDGAFSMETLPTVPNLSFELVYNAQSIVLTVTSALPGDYNVDGTVDAADYVVWRKNDGMPEEYDTWRANFGATAGSGSLSNTTVPEPASIWLLIWGAAIGTRRGRRIAS